MVTDDGVEVGGVENVSTDIGLLLVTKDSSVLPPVV